MSVPPADPFAAVGLRATATARLLARDPSLGEGLDRQEAERASERAWARVIELPVGDARLPADPDAFPSWWGLLLLDGFLLRRVEIGRASWPELLGAGDLIRPWTAASDTLSSIPAHVRFEVVAPSRLALLDRAFALRVAPWPEIAAALLDRAVERAHELALMLAAEQPPLVDERVWMVLWQLADRWGTMSREGVVIPLPILSHQVLAEMLGVRRPTVSLAVRRLSDAGLLTHRPRHGWTLRGPPGSLSPAADRHRPERPATIRDAGGPTSASE